MGYAYGFFKKNGATFLKRGAFSIRLTPKDWCGIALDECHETKINKDCKLAIIRPNKDKMSHVANYLGFGAKMVNNFKGQIFDKEKEERTTACYTPTSRSRKSDENITSMLETLQIHGLHSSNYTHLCTLIEHKQATPEQKNDLLSFRAIGQRAFESFIEYHILNRPSTAAPVRRKKLLTFTIKESQRRKVALVEKERKITQKFLKRQLAWMAENNITSPPHDMLCSISSLPRALADSSGLPYKSSKSLVTQYLTKRYNSVTFNGASLVILKGMFMIQTSPLPGTERLRDYATMLFLRWIKPHLQRGDVHVIFDNPGGLKESPKEIEQGRRDSIMEETRKEHKCSSFESNAQVSGKWRGILACRKCKTALITYLGKEFLQMAPPYMPHGCHDREFIANIGNIAYSCTKSEGIIERPTLYTNTEEADERIWLHCVHSGASKILIFSPDTDTYHVGLAHLEKMPQKDIIVQLSSSSTSNGGRTKFLHLNALLEGLSRDSDLGDIPLNDRPQVLQSLYASTGCDYVSYFAGIGKCTFLSTFYQYAGFIAGGKSPNPVGSIGKAFHESSFYSFLRLIGCAYFKKHASGFEQCTPVSLYYSVKKPAADEFDTHKEWLDIIRRRVWMRADLESHNVPTTDALRLHWHRCLWVLELWHSATENEIELPGM